MSAFGKDLSWRVFATALFSAIGVAVTAFNGSHVWWALPIAAVLSLLGGLLTSVTGFGSLAAAVEKAGWTALQVALAALPVTLWGVPDAYVPLIAAVLALAKGAVAKKVGNPNTASIP
jgi:hypothetical protein